MNIIRRDSYLTSVNDSENTYSRSDCWTVLITGRNG